MLDIVTNISNKKRINDTNLRIGSIPWSVALHFSVSFLDLGELEVLCKIFFPLSLKTVLYLKHPRL